MATLRSNIAANYIGQMWMALMSVAFIPFYVKLLGIESFALVGLMLSIQALAMVLDFGAGGVLNRELARRSHVAGEYLSRRDLVRTLECLIWPATALIAGSIWFLSGYFVNNWLHLQSMPKDEVTHAVAIMGLAVATQFPTSFYGNGLSGLEQQKLLNALNIVFSTLRNAGVLLVLYFYSASIIAFMTWYAILGALQSVTLACALWHQLPGQAPAKFLASEVLNVRGFAGGLFLISLFSVAVTQVDKIILSVSRPLADFGYFSLAVSIAGGARGMIQPMFNATYPRYSRLVSLNAKHQLSTLYHLSNKYLGIVTAALFVPLIFFSKTAVYLWTGDHLIAETLDVPLKIYCAGAALNAMMSLPYALQLAHGMTRLAIAINLLAIFAGIPFCLWTISQFGILGASFFWFFLNLLSVLVAIPIMHRQLPGFEMRKWYLEDMLPPLLISTLAALVCKLVFSEMDRSISGLLAFFLVVLMIACATALSSRDIRTHLKKRIALGKSL